MTNPQSLINSQPRALFITPDGAAPIPDYLICSGQIPLILNGHPCPYSDNGRMPLPQPLDAASQAYSIDKGQPGDLCPPCCKQNLGNLGHWEGHQNIHHPAELHELRLFKCRQWFWVVVPGLIHAEPTRIQEVEHAR